MQNAFCYITTAPFFWPTMGLIVFMSVFIGATLYNGDLKLLAKGIITTISYGLLVLLVDVTRVSNVLSAHASANQVTQAYASEYTLLFVTIFYIFGIVLGVLSVKYARHKRIN